MGFRALFQVPGIFLFFIVAINSHVHAQEISFSGKWQGALTIGRDTTGFVFIITEIDGKYAATLSNTSIGIYGYPADSVTVKDKNLTIRLNALDIEFTGTIQLDSSNKPYAIIGDWFQASELSPIVLERQED